MRKKPIPFKDFKEWGVGKQVTLSKKKTVPQALADLGALYKDRNAIYKDNYKSFGAVLKALFPRGLQLQSEADFGRLAMFVMIMAKTTRYSHAFQSGHEDSLNDISVYAQMLQEYDGETVRP